MIGLFPIPLVGRSLTFEYTSVLGEPRIHRVTGPLGLEILYAYDEYANLVGVTRGTRVEQYEYSTEQVVDRHNLTAYVDPNLHRTEYVYFPDGALFPGEQGDEWAQGKHEFVKEVRRGGGSAGEERDGVFVRRDGFLVDGGAADDDDGHGRSEETEYVLNADGSPLTITEPGSVVTTMVWSSTDIVKLQERDANGRETDYEYDGNANLTNALQAHDRSAEATRAERPLRARKHSPAGHIVDSVLPSCRPNELPQVARPAAEPSACSRSRRRSRGGEPRARDHG